jgi:uncharacterized protein YgiM (DUF1202 family)
MSSVGFPIFFVTTLLVGTAAAIVLTPKDVLRSAVVEAPAPSRFTDTAADLPSRSVLRETASAPVVQVASMTVEVTPLSEPAPIIATAPAAEIPKDIRRITAGILNMRAEPNKYSDLVASLPRGTEVAVSDTSGSWAYVTTSDGTTGWLSQNFLTPVSH